MKNLTKMLAMAAAVSSMQFAKAESVEKEFVPGGTIQQISIVNGQLEVRSNGAKIQNVETPYVYVGTNTTRFAENAFANGGLTNLSEYVHAGAGKIFMRENGNTKDVWETEIKAAPAALNGVTSVKKVEENTANNSNVSAALLEVMAKSTEDGNLTKIFDGELYRVNGESKDHLIRYNAITKEWDVGQSLLSAPNDKEIVDFVIVNGSLGRKTYIVYNDDGIKKSQATSDPDNFINGKTVTSIALASDNKTVVLVNGGINLVDGTNGRKVKEEKTETSLSSGQQTTLMNNAIATAAPKEIVSSVFAGKVLYWATANTLGYTR